MNPSMQKMLEDLLTSGNVPSEVSEAVREALSDPTKLDHALEKLEVIGAHQVGSGAPLNIIDYYKPAPGKYELRWPLGSPVSLPMPFDDLDRQTQFFVLFQEWSRRELEGMVFLTSGDLKGADTVFQECVERAKQIDVRELEARSYEGFLRVAQRRGDRRAVLAWVSKAVAARRA
jgi:hypothetical protein